MEFAGDKSKQASGGSEIDNEAERHALSWHSIFTSPPHYDQAGKLVTCRDSVNESVVASHSVGLPDCGAEALSEKDLSLLPALKLDQGAHHGKFVIAFSDAEKEAPSASESADDAHYGLRSSYQRESSNSYLHASINQKQGGIDEVFADEHLSSPGPIKRLTEPDVWTVGTVSAGHEERVYSSSIANVWVGVGATVNPVFDRELREKISAAPTTVFTNVRIDF